MVEKVEFYFNGFVVAPSDDRLIIAAGPQELKDDRMQMIAKLVNAGKGTFSENAEMAKLIKGVDTGKPAWAVVKMSDSYRQCPFFQGIETATVTVDIKDNVATGKLVAEGKDAAAVQASLEEFNKELDNAKAEIKESAERVPAAFKSMLDQLSEFLAAVEVKAEGTKVTGSVQVKDFSKFMALPATLFGARAEAVERPARVDARLRREALVRGTKKN